MSDTARNAPDWERLREINPARKPHFDAIEALRIQRDPAAILASAMAARWVTLASLAPRFHLRLQLRRHLDPNTNPTCGGASPSRVPGCRQAPR